MLRTGEVGAAALVHRDEDSVPRCMAAMESSSCRMKCGISSSLSLRLAAKKMRLSIVCGRVASCIQESMRIEQTSKHCALVREEQEQSPAHRGCAWPACRPRLTPVSRICAPHHLQPWPCVWGLLADRPRSASHHRCDGKAVRLFTVSMKRRRQRRSICLSQTEVLCWTTWPAGFASVHKLMNSSAMTIRLHNCICEEHDVWALTIIDQQGRPAYYIFTLTAQSLHANGAEIGTPICFCTIVTTDLCEPPRRG